MIGYNDGEAGKAEAESIKKANIVVGTPTYRWSQRPRQKRARQVAF